MRAPTFSPPRVLPSDQHPPPALITPPSLILSYPRGPQDASCVSLLLVDFLCYA